MRQSASLLKIVIAVAIGLFVAIVALKVLWILLGAAMSIFLIFVNIAVIIVICYVIWWFIKSVIGTGKQDKFSDNSPISVPTMRTILM